MLMTKNGEGKFYFAYHSSKMQDVSRETRQAIRETQMSYDAVVILTDRKSRQLTGVSRKISPVQRVDTDGNSHLRGDNDYVRVLAKHKGRTTAHADLRQLKDFAQILPLVMWIPTISFTVGAHKFRKERLRICGPVRD